MDDVSALIIIGSISIIISRSMRYAAWKRRGKLQHVKVCVRRQQKKEKKRCDILEEAFAMMGALAWQARY